MSDNNRFGSWLWMNCEESSKRTDDVWSWNSRSSWLDLWQLKSISKIKSFTYCSVKFTLRFSLSARWSIYEDIKKRNRAWKMWRWCVKIIILILFNLNINNIKMANIDIMFGGVIINVIAFVGGNYLAKYLSSDSACEEKKRHDLAVKNNEK